ncbi:MAG: rod shape-determining protein MreD [Pseudomonadota bacterium]
MNPFQGGWAILLTLLVGMVLAVLHLPEASPPILSWLRPNWVIMMLFFWTLAVPQRMGLVFAWLLGIGLDVLLGEPLGLNGALLAGFTYVVWALHARLRVFPAVQQAVLLFGLVVIVEALRLIVLLTLNDVPPSWRFPFIALASAALWPPLRGILEQVQRACRVV